MMPGPLLLFIINSDRTWMPMGGRNTEEEDRIFSQPLQ